MADVAFVLHGHFYQPPRENPWTEVVPHEPSAAPFHDWNARITAECYRPNGWARILDDHGRIMAIVDNYERLSFNVGPTLMSWLDEHAPETYARIVDADRVGRRAIAQGYGHAILPLCNDRDLRTQVRWGLADFRHRFGREAEGLWLPETAVDDRTLAVLAEEGVGFTILAPGQVAAVRPAGGDGEWQPAGDGARLPGTARWRHPHQADLGVDLVIYDGPISHDVAFGGFPSQVVVERIVGRARGDLVSVACDGETFGHHHHYADRGVAYALTVEADRRHVRLPRIADWLVEHPPAHEARVHTSAWSCAHGVGRWAEDCGCHTGGEPGWNQAWRRPLRAAFDRVRDAAVEVFERRGGAVLRDPWAARDAYVDVLLGVTSIERFAADHVLGHGADGGDGADGDHAHGDQGDGALVEALTLLESQRHALLMYTSCGWFFNDLAGLETVQIMRYAARCLDLLAEMGERPPVDEVLAVLAEAQSNDPDEGDGRQVWARHVDTSRVDPGRVVAHLALTELVAGPGDHGPVAGYELTREIHDAVDRGGVAVCAGRVVLTHGRTRRSTAWTYAAVHLGGLEVFGALRPADPDVGRDEAAVADLLAKTRGGARVTTLLRTVLDRFGSREFGLADALPGEAEELMRSTAGALADRFVAAYDQLRTDHHDTLAALATARTPLPPELSGPVEVAVDRRLRAAVDAAQGSTDPADYRAVRALAHEARQEGVQASSPAAAAALAEVIGRAADDAAAAPGAATVDRAVGLLRLVRDVGLDVPLDAAQERVHAALRDARLGDDGRAALAPLARRLGVSTRPLELPGP